MPTFEEDMEAAAEDLGMGSDWDNMGYVEDMDDEVGAPRRRPRRRRPAGRPRVRIPVGTDKGEGVVWPLGSTLTAVSVAAAASGTLTFTPNRNISIRDIYLDVSVAAAGVANLPCAGAAIAVTSVLVQGREQTAGTGNIPISMFSPLNPIKTKFVFDNCLAGQSIVVSFTNNDAATTFLVSGVIIVTTIR